MWVQELREPAALDTGPLRLVERDRPEPAAGEIAVDVSCCGVCRTDLQLVAGELPPRRLPIVPGHQIVGRVRAVGAGVDRWQPGDRVGIAWLGGACGTCARCRTGRENLCDSAEFTGWDRDGGYGESVVARADFAVPIPDGFGDLDAAPLLCGGVIGYRALRVADVEPGSHLGLYGFGASALLTIQVARHWGCKVYVATRSPIEQERARRLGAVWTGSYDDRPPVELDAAITFAPAGSVVVAALSALAPGGTVAVNAIHLDRVPEFDYDLLWRERVIRSVANFTRRDAEEFLALAAEIPVTTVTELAPLADANAVLARAAHGEVEGAAVLTTGA